MERPTCKTCPYWKQLSEAELYGECRPSPAKHGYPTEVQCDPGTVNISQGKWFDQHEDDWCGAHPSFPAYIASLKKPRTVPEMEAEIAAIQGEIGAAIGDSIKEFGLHPSGPAPAESTGNSVLDSLMKTVEKY